MNTRFARAILAIGMLIGSMTAQAVLIDFDSFSTGSFSGGTEDGFSITATSGSIWFTPFSNNSLGVDAPGTIATATFTTTQLFEFESLDFAVRDGATPGLTVEGYLGSLLVGIDTFAAPTTFDAYTSYSAANLSGVSLDRLLLTFTSSDGYSPRIDNISLADATVSEPSALALFSLGLAGFGLYRKREKKRGRL